eukprot:236569_1
MGNEKSNHEDSNKTSIVINTALEPVPSSVNNANMMYQIQTIVDISPPTPNHCPNESCSTMTPLTESKLNTPVLTPRSSRLSSKMNIPLTIPDLTSETTSFPPLPCTYKRKRSSFSHVCNGITGRHISGRIIKIAALFWQQNITNLPMNKRLEIGCGIYLGALSTNKQMKKIMIDYVKNKNSKIEGMSLKFIDMIGWLIRYLLTDNIDLYTMLIRLGVFHQQLGVKINHFSSMLQSIHETFTYYFPTKYTIKEKYAMDEIFTLCAQFMTGEDLKYAPLLSNIGKSFET